MKKLFLCTLILFLLTIFLTPVNAQQNDWKKISPKKEEFSLEIPKKHYQDKQVNFIGSEIVLLAQYRSFSNSTYFLISTSKLKDWKFLEEILEYANAYKAEQKQVSFNHIKGTQYSFIDSENFYNNLIVVSTNKHHYIFHIASELSDDPQIEKFIQSIEFREKSKNGTPIKKTRKPDKRIVEAAEKIVAQYEKTQLDKKKKLLSANTQSSDEGGAGENSKNNVDSSEDTDSRIDSVETTPFKVIRKAKPGYSGLARYYNITGIVRLKVEFLDNGKIGEVTTLTRLPFGLTQRAIRVAKQIEFIPPTKNGVKYTVTKVVQYSYTTSLDIKRPK